MSNFDPITLAVLLALMALMPTLVVVSTSFLKIATSRSPSSSTRSALRPGARLPTRSSDRRARAPPVV